VRDNAPQLRVLISIHYHCRLHKTSSEAQFALPADDKHQTYVSVKAIVAGKLSIPLKLVLEDCHDEPDSNAIEAPVFAFLITHPERGHNLFDLGLRKVSQQPCLYHCLRYTGWEGHRRISSCCAPRGPQVF
jgi:hypothetical protein